jgi:hypothetical protein
VVRLGRDAPQLQIALACRHADAGTRKVEVVLDAIASLPAESLGATGR